VSADSSVWYSLSIIIKNIKRERWGETLSYDIHTDKDFFERFTKLSKDLRELSLLFQNPNAMVAKEEVAEWIDAVDKFNYEFQKIENEAHGRIHPIE
jgi:hypothetical protein